MFFAHFYTKKKKRTERKCIRKIETTAIFLSALVPLKSVSRFLYNRFDSFSVFSFLFLFFISFDIVSFVHVYTIHRHHSSHCKWFWRVRQFPMVWVQTKKQSILLFFYFISFFITPIQMHAMCYSRKHVDT